MVIRIFIIIKSLVRVPVSIASIEHHFYTETHQTFPMPPRAFPLEKKRRLSFEQDEQPIGERKRTHIDVSSAASAITRGIHE
jgi:hypothetical protein